MEMNHHAAKQNPSPKRSVGFVTLEERRDLDEHQPYFRGKGGGGGMSTKWRLVKPQVI